MLYEGLKEKGALMLVPQTAVESMGLEDYSERRVPDSRPLRRVRMTPRLSERRVTRGKRNPGSAASRPLL